MYGNCLRACLLISDANKVDYLRLQDLNGRLLTVNKASPKGSRAERLPRVLDAEYRVYAGNLPWNVDDARLEQVFSEHGKVVNARVVYDRETGRSRGFGFVVMASETEMNDAIAALDGQVLLRFMFFTHFWLSQAHPSGFVHVMVEETCTNYFRCIVHTAAAENISGGFVNLLASVFVIDFG